MVTVKSLPQARVVKIGHLWYVRFKDGRYWKYSYADESNPNIIADTLNESWDSSDVMRDLDLQHHFIAGITNVVPFRALIDALLY